MKILVTGSDSRFGKILKNIKTNKKFIFRDKKSLDILSVGKNLHHKFQHCSDWPKCLQYCILWLDEVHLKKFQKS